jgi:hypothetical protein
MAQYAHLTLERLPERLERRKRPGFGQLTARDPQTQATHLTSQLAGAVEQQRQRRPASVDPDLILRVTMAGQDQEDFWNRSGLTVVASDASKTLILFSTSDELAEFKQRIEAYRGGPPEGQKHPPHAAFISAIESIGAIQPADRIGVRLQALGICEPADFDPATDYTLDVALWDLGDRLLRQARLSSVKTLVEESGGQVLDDYLGAVVTMVRVRASGRIVRTLLDVDVIATIDLAPVPDLEVDGLLATDITSAPPLGPIPDDLPLIGIIDSGINAHPWLDPLVVGQIGLTDTGDTADLHGHGTRVAGIAAYGDFRTQLQQDELIPGAKLCFAKVVNDSGNFDDIRLVPKLMEQALRDLQRNFGCRIFVIALADRERVFADGKVGPWAATLDALARELDVLIIVSAGNRNPRKAGPNSEEGVTLYPQYLLEPENRIFEPANAMNALTVGALAHGPGLDPGFHDDAKVRTITDVNEPAPFTRIGPGVGGSRKPDLVDVGGTMIFDAVLQKLLYAKHQRPATGVLTTSPDYRAALLVSSAGTSYAAPRVAFRAAQLLRIIPNASANLLRALLVNAADVPIEAASRLAALQDGAIGHVCGAGVADHIRGTYSDDARVVFYTEDELASDHFAVFRIPIPPDYQTTAGSRHLRVTLAYDPPVRETRNDYRGLTMEYQVVRGKTPAEVFKAFRRPQAGEEGTERFPAKYTVNLRPGISERNRSTIQTGRASFERNISQYGDEYFLVVSCKGGWAPEFTRQRFGVVVEISHTADIRLYERLQQRVQVRA